MTRGLQDDKALWKLVMTPNKYFILFIMVLGKQQEKYSCHMDLSTQQLAPLSCWIIVNHRIVTNSHTAEKMTIDINTHSKSHRLLLHTQERAEHAQIPTVQ
jgi:hypothetical protein